MTVPCVIVKEKNNTHREINSYQSLNEILTLDSQVFTVSW